MMISRAQISQIMKVYKARGQNHAVSQAKGPADQAKADALSLSFKQADIDRVKELVSAMPDVREDKVAELRKKIESGTYDVDPKEIADKIIGRLMADKVK